MKWVMEIYSLGIIVLGLFCVLKAEWVAMKISKINNELPLWRHFGGKHIRVSKRFVVIIGVGLLLLGIWVLVMIAMGKVKEF
jgi:hypothetical protein